MKTSSSRIITVLLLVSSCLFASGCNKKADQAEKNGQLVRTYFSEVWNKGHVDTLDNLLSKHYINHTPSVPNPPEGPEGLKPIVLAIRKGFPDLHYQIVDVITTNDRVVARVVMTGTNTGPLLGNPPTGKKIRVNQINIEKIENGRISEHWRVTDELELNKQLGLLK